MLRSLVFLLVLPVLVAAASVGAAPKVPVPATAFVFSGHGWGHGVGLSQYGALGFAQHGARYDRILAHYYPGTKLGLAPVTKVRVLLAEGKRPITISSPAPFILRTTTGAKTLPAGSYTVPGTASPPAAFAPGNAPLELGGKQYRGSIRIVQAGQVLQAVNVLSLDAYLYGVIASEMESSWPLEALKAQAVAARSYAVVSRRTGEFDLYSDVRSQVYGGMAAETTPARAAVDGTRHRVLLYDGRVAQTFFSASSGGRTADVTDVWLDSKPVPYLVSVEDPYDTVSPYHDWGPVAITAASAAKTLGIPGLRGLTVRRAPSQRVRELSIGAERGPVVMAGNTFRRALGLRSTWFRVGELTLERPLSPVAAGAEVTLAGRVLGLTGVVLDQRPAGGDWQAAVTLAPGRGGTFSLVAKPLVTTDYRLRTGEAAGEAVRVTVE